MPGFPDYDRTTFGFVCPKCGHRTLKTLAWLKENSEYQCAGCKALLPVVERENILNVFKSITPRP